MKVLVLGGTVFLGRHLVDSALACGHEVTLFNRGKTNNNLYPELEKLVGDRDGGLDALKGRKWDVVMDPSGYVPRLVRDSAELLKDAVEYYTFISSIAVYSDWRTPNMDESGPLGTMEDETNEDVMAYYGPLKVLCEKVAEEVMPGRVLNVRAGLIVGPHDPADRFTYWPMRVDRGGEILAPSDPDYSVQFIHGRDLADWCMLMAEQRKGGIYNATGRHMPISQLLEACQQVSGNNSTITYVNSAFLLEQEVGAWMEQPVWAPSGSFWAPTERSGLLSFNVDKVFADGMITRPVEQIVRETLAWKKTNPERPPAAGGSERLKIGLDPDKEAKILAAWKAC